MGSSEYKCGNLKIWEFENLKMERGYKEEPYPRDLKFEMGKV
jgi:hypothetical protein